MHIPTFRPYTVNNALYCWGLESHGALGIGNPQLLLGVPTTNQHVRHLGTNTAVTVR